MAKFRDNQKREWVLTIDVPVAREIQRELGINILITDLNDDDCGLVALNRDPILLCDVLYLLCRRQAEKRGVSDEDFGRALFGEAIGDAADAFVEALADFTPPCQRKILTAMETTAKSLQETLVGMAETKIPKAVREIQDLIAGSGKSSPGSKGSSDSRPPAASAN